MVGLVDQLFQLASNQLLKWLIKHGQQLLSIHFIYHFIARGYDGARMLLRCLSDFLNIFVAVCKSRPRVKGGITVVQDEWPDG